MIRNYSTLTDLWHEASAEMLFARTEELDFISSADTMVYDNVLSADSMAFDFDAGRDLWLTRSRFTVLQRAYLNLGELDAFLNRCEDIGLGSAKRGVVTQMFARQHSRADKKYKWGNCMLGWCFRGGNRLERPVLILHSRVSYIAYIGGLDLALCHVLAGEIAKRIGRKTEDFAFRWHCDSLQFHGFKSLPYLYGLGYENIFHEGRSDFPSSTYPTLKLVRRWYSDVVRKHEEGKTLEAERYGPLRRIRKRYQQHIENNPLPSVPLSSMSFDPLRRQ